MKMRTIRRMHGQRGALEGLPLYLIILIVVAAIVVAILVGWLSTLQHPAVGNVSFALDTMTGGSGSPSTAISCPAYPSCPVGTATAVFTQNGDGSCPYVVNSQSGGTALLVTVDDKSGHALSGATVTLAGTGISVNAQPALTQTTDGNGQVSFSGVSGTVPTNDPAGGSISISVSYSSGGLTTTGSQNVNVEPPTIDATTGASVTC